MTPVPPNPLSAAARAVTAFVEDHLLDDDGLCRCFLNADTRRPWTNEELRAGGFKLGNVFLDNCNDPAAYLAYEDSLMATGEYALARITEFERTGDARALAAAAFPIAAILRVFQQGALYEKGFLPKPHGGLRGACYSHEISPDQQIKAVVALRAWQPYAPPAHSRVTDGYLVALADYHLARDFKHPRREAFVVTPENRPHVVSILVPILWIAGKLTGRPHYHAALRRFDRILDFLAEGKAESGFDLVLFNLASLLAEGLHLAAAEGLQDPRFPVIIRKFWDLTLPFVRQDGYGRLEGHCTAASLRMPSIAALVEPDPPGGGARTEGWRILSALRDPLAMRAEKDAAPLAPPAAWLARSIREIAVTSWLLGYWRLAPGPDGTVGNAAEHSARR